MTDAREIDRIVTAALDEDAPWGDLTSETLIPVTATATAELVAREPGVLSGVEVFAAAFRLTDPRIVVELLAADGDPFEGGDVLARVQGPARGILTAERVGLNLVQRMSGVATLTARYVAAVAGAGARIVDTRKTTPGLRSLERQAVRDGGGRNHRRSLSDAIMAKDNHLAVLTSGGRDLATALRDARERMPHTAHLEVEVDRLDQLDAVLAGGADTIMLDNFTLDDLRAGVERIGGRAMVEASGGVSLDTVAAIAATGVDVISVGALTHSARALDLGLDVVIEAAPSDAGPAAAASAVPAASEVSP
jgi:nicotinate-nucleotide pyrophosphorylase (carboxylating)